MKIDMFKIEQLWRYLELGNTIRVGKSEFALSEDYRIGYLGTRKRDDVIEIILLECHSPTLEELQKMVDSFSLENWVSTVIAPLALTEQNKKQ